MSPSSIDRGCGNFDDDQAESSRKKRLSRKEQKARKRQRKLQEQPEQQQQEQQSPEAPKEQFEKDNDAATSKKKSKKKKKKKNKNKNKIDPSPEDSNKTVKDTAAPKDSTTTTISTSTSNSPWQPLPLQEDVPYVPTPIPEASSSHHYNDKTLGKWFPKARVMKSVPSSSENCTILLFYQYKSPTVWPPRKVDQLISYLEQVAAARPQLGGRLRVAPEGINATLSCGDTHEVNGRTILEHFTRDLQQFDSVFQETDFKYLPAKADRHFKDLKLLPVQELVFYGIREDEAPLSETGVHLEAKDFHNMLQDTSKETVVIDVRNHYEAALGRFDGQERRQLSSSKDDGNNEGSGGAKYIDPMMRKSTDFPEWVKSAQDELKGKRVMMYCTGGVRCERASAYLKKTMGDSVDGVFQLQGGIERYLQAFPDGGYWTGSNFVFDKRESVSAENPNGDGGVLPKKKKQLQLAQKSVVDTKCCLCDRPWDRYVGKKKCETCGVPVLMCDSCMSTRHDKQKKKKIKKQNDNNKVENVATSSKEGAEEKRKLARCPLCVQQNITVRVEDVEYTDNGVHSKYQAEAAEGKAAPSVLKWGGGHAAKKKERRRNHRSVQQSAAGSQEY